ncbi:MAG: hypothetical protein D3909_04425 [Candidatus Electrothrix sp. ATG1]|nr:hypothetical protein [Candidatus Electrothrix sp. ATG1]
MSTTKVLLAGVITLAITCPPCHHIASAGALDANTKKSERKYRKKKDGKGALTQKMLEACIELKSEIDEEFEKISGSKEEYDTLNNEVSNIAAHLKENKEQLTDKGDEAFDEHNEQVEVYTQKLEELKKLEKAYKKKSVIYQEKTDQLKKECNDQPYYEDDYAAAIKKTGKKL